MRSAIISDIQGNMAALAAVWADIETHSVEAVYCAGDLTGYGASPNEVIDFVQSAGIAIVMGDFDEIVGFDLSASDHYHPDNALEFAGIEALRWNQRAVGPDQKRYLRSLPLQLRDQLSGLKMLLVHGSPRSMNEYLFEDRPAATFAEVAKFAGADLIIFGHTGQAYAKQLDGTWFLNAGSVGGQPDDVGQANYWLIESGSGLNFELRTVAYSLSLVEPVGSNIASASQPWPGEENSLEEPLVSGTTSLTQPKGEL